MCLKYQKSGSKLLMLCRKAKKTLRKRGYRAIFAPPPGRFSPGLNISLPPPGRNPKTACVEVSKYGSKLSTTLRAVSLQFPFYMDLVFV